ncbi:putative Phosphomannomutase 2 [Blattamonas nauphoetae]|uniref:Phosphomannomutase n=1 Tax=Blattamonas nauphoetae TaxID=2049346 RepID=A0ABQ9X3M2_9EUKA|nr:putative Phosphomannomutase 2 [Blattamonas nauphoetae]
MTQVPKHPVLVLFDIDGTLTPSRNVASQEMIQFITQLQTVVDVGFVGGSDRAKQIEQMGEELVHAVTYSFSENGLVAFKGKTEIECTTITSHVGEARLKEFINDTLLLLARCDIPIKRGTFIEFRNGMLNVSPIGRNCTQAERNDFFAYDNQHHVRQTLIDALKPKYGDIFTFSIGGQISFDVFPIGWNKSYCLKFCQGYDKIHFFGDKTMEGGNDYEIFIDPRVEGHSVIDPADTIKQCSELFLRQ